MKILALELSSSQRSVAVVQQNAHSTQAAEVIETGGKAAKLFEMIERALSQAGLEREQIDCLAIGLGPGSYNGIRAAIAVAQGWQLAARTRLLGIASVECLVQQARDEGFLGLLNVVIDAQRNEFYLAQYELDSERSAILSPLRLATLAEVQVRQAAGERIAGPDLEQRFEGAASLFPRASVLGKLALGRTEFVSGDQLEPIYLRDTNFVKAPPPRILP